MTRQQTLEWELRVSALLAALTARIGIGRRPDDIADRLARLIAWREAWERDA